MGRSNKGVIVQVLRWAAVVAGMAALAGPAAAECRPDLVRVEGAWGHANFTVEVADDPAERAQGLMDRPQMGMLEGMLFIYETPQRASFWMRNTLIPLDMLFIAADGTIASLHANAVPLDETPIPGGDDVKYVLEINGGMAARLGIAVGDHIQHPDLGAGAVLACAE